MRLGVRRPGGVELGSSERRLSGLVWNFTQRGFALEHGDRHIAEVLTGIRRKHTRPPVAKNVILAEGLLALRGRLGHDLRVLRDVRFF